MWPLPNNFINDEKSTGIKCLHKKEIRYIDKNLIFTCSVSDAGGIPRPYIEANVN